MTLHPDTLPFLSELMVNNNRAWFAQQKPRWEAIKQQFEQLTQLLIDDMVQHDSSLEGLTAKQCVYRIYRDTRFSPDKTPYKTHVSCFLPSFGKKNMGVPGYFLQVGTDEAYGLMGTVNLGGGIFMPESPTLQAIRQEIFYNTDDFLSILHNRSYKKYYGADFFTSHKLTRAPKGYPNDWEYADLLKYKDYCCSCILDTALIEQENFSEEVLRAWHAAVPLNRFILRAISE